MENIVFEFHYIHVYVDMYYKLDHFQQALEIRTKIVYERIVVETLVIR